MNRAMLAAAMGMSVEQRRLDVIADNMANADVVGFKQAQLRIGAAGANGERAGARADGTRVIHTQGRLVRTGGPFDLAIDGPGFFAVRRAGGAPAYTRDGQFSRDPDGSLRTADGAVLEGIRIPAGAISVDVDVTGRVTAKSETGERLDAGRIRLATFGAPERLRHVEGAVFEATSAAGAPRLVDAGGLGGPKLRFGELERANVSIMESMMELLATQRAFEADSKGVQAADEMLRIADNIARS